MTTADTLFVRQNDYRLYQNWLTEIGERYKTNMQQVKQPSDSELVDAMNEYFAIYDAPKY